MSIKVQAICTAWRDDGELYWIYKCPTCDVLDRLDRYSHGYEYKVGDAVYRYCFTCGEHLEVVMGAY